MKVVTQHIGALPWGRRSSSSSISGNSGNSKLRSKGAGKGGEVRDLLDKRDTPSTDVRTSEVYGVEEDVPEFTVEGLGDKRMTVEVNGKTTAILVGDQPGLLERMGGGVKSVIGAASRELTGITSSDPAFSLSQAARVVKPVVLQDMPDDVQGLTDQYFFSLVRAVQLGLDVKRFLDRWRNRKELSSQSVVSKVNLAVTGARVVTDVLGLVGSLGTIVPALSSVSSPLMTTALIGDIAGFSTNMLEYMHTRSQGPPVVQLQSTSK